MIVICSAVKRRNIKQTYSHRFSIHLISGNSVYDLLKTVRFGSRLTDFFAGRKKNATVIMLKIRGQFDSLFPDESLESDFGKNKE